ncbi:hypothetical protein B0T14DRAFT_88895 [Immersiella caudata]|uniref:Uncharacterized protein n=1 Tax=Immersiella caudata TaxID=314043 RepID=A0AA39X321_9PEZI|nr:hypothetical protein B0T14DRAFT_88895 [Immersiella caudata]
MATTTITTSSGLLTTLVIARGTRQLFTRSTSMVWCYVSHWSRGVLVQHWRYSGGQGWEICGRVYCAIAMLAHVVDFKGLGLDSGDTMCRCRVPAIWLFHSSCWLQMCT